MGHELVIPQVYPDWAIHYFGVEIGGETGEPGPLGEPADARSRLESNKQAIQETVEIAKAMTPVNAKFAELHAGFMNAQLVFAAAERKAEKDNTYEEALLKLEALKQAATALADGKDEHDKLVQAARGRRGAPARGRKGAPARGQNVAPAREQPANQNYQAYQEVMKEHNLKQRIRETLRDDLRPWARKEAEEAKKLYLTMTTRTVKEGDFEKACNQAKEVARLIAESAKAREEMAALGEAFDQRYDENRSKFDDSDKFLRIARQLPGAEFQHVEKTVALFLTKVKQVRSQQQADRDYRGLDATLTEVLKLLDQVPTLKETQAYQESLKWEQSLEALASDAETLAPKLVPTDLEQLPKHMQMAHSVLRDLRTATDKHRQAGTFEAGLNTAEQFADLAAAVRSDYDDYLADPAAYLKEVKQVENALGEALSASAFSTVTIAELSTTDGRATIEQQLLDELERLHQTVSPVTTGQDLGDKSSRIRTAFLTSTLDGLAQDYAGLTAFRIADAVPALQAGIAPQQLKGVSLRHCNFAKFNSGTEVPPPKRIAGNGNCNSVEQIHYTDGPRIYKEEAVPDKWGKGAWLEKNAAFMGIDHFEDPRYGNRNIASGLVGDLLGTTVLVKTDFAITGGADGKGQVGIVMEQANGNTLSAAEVNNLKTLEDVKNLAPWAADLSSKARASLQKQMMDLEGCDFLTRQTDRHFGNYLIDVKGDDVTVKGIDNDFAFGKHNEGYHPSTLVQLRNPPKLMSKEMAEKVDSLEFDSEVAPQFAGLLTNDEIKAARERFNRLKVHVAALKSTGGIVDDWETWESKDGENVTTFLAGGESIFGQDVLPVIEKVEQLETSPEQPGGGNWGNSKLFGV